jgi:hypothetical protein
MTQNKHKQTRKYPNEVCKRKKKELVNNRIRETEEETRGCYKQKVAYSTNL